VFLCVSNLFSVKDEPAHSIEAVCDSVQENMSDSLCQRINVCHAVADHVCDFVAKNKCFSRVCFCGKQVSTIKF